MAGDSRDRVYAVDMHSAGLLRAFFRFAPALSCLFFTGSRASEAEGQDLIQLLPNEVGWHMSSFLSMGAYLSMLQTSKGILENFQLLLKMELGMLARDFDEKSAAGLMHMRVGSALLAKAKGKQGSLGRLLKKLVDEIFAAPDGEAKDACRCALVADKRLDDIFWGEYVGVTVSQITDATAPSKDVIKRLETILGVAARVGSLETIEAIVSSLERTHVKVDLGANRDYAIKWAWVNGHTEVVQFLLEDGGFISDEDGYLEPIAPDAEKSVALEFAAEYGHVWAFKGLLAVNEGDSGMRNDINLAANDNCIIRAASENGHDELVKFLLEMKIARHKLFEGIDPAADHNSAIRWAAENGHVEVVKFLLEMKIAHPELFGGIDPAITNNYAIRTASSNGHSEVVKVLLEMKIAHPELFQGIDPAVNDNYALRMAALRGHSEVVQLLLDMKIAHPGLFEGIDPAAGDNDAIQSASSNGHSEVVKVLLLMKKKHFKVFERIDPADGNGAIIWASWHGRAEVVRVLLEMRVAHPELFKGFDPAAKDNEAIVKAMANGCIEVVKVLLEKKEEDTDNKFGYQNIDPAARNNEGPERASKNGHVEMIEFLRERKAARPDLYEGLILDW